MFSASEGGGCSSAVHVSHGSAKTATCLHSGTRDESSTNLSIGGKGRRGQPPSSPPFFSFLLFTRRPRSKESQVPVLPAETAGGQAASPATRCAPPSAATWTRESQPVWMRNGRGARVMSNPQSSDGGGSRRDATQLISRHMQTSVCSHLANPKAMKVAEETSMP